MKAKTLGVALATVVFISCSIFSINGNRNSDPDDFMAIYEKADYATYLELEVQYEVVSYEKDEKGQWVEKKEKEKKDLYLSGLLIYYNNNFYVVTAGHLRNDNYEILKISTSFKYPTETQEMEIVGYDNLIDVALLKFKNKEFQFGGQAAKFGKSANLQPLEPVMAIGTQFGEFRYAPTKGSIIQIIDHSENYPRPSLILHDAITNPGNSGGPLINRKGEIIGMNVMVKGHPYNNFYTPLYLSMPIDYIAEVLPMLEKGGEVAHAALPGLYLANDDLQEKVFVSKVAKDSLASQTGFQKDDIILSYDGQKPKNIREVYEYIFMKKKPDEKMKFKISRNKQEMDLEATLVKYSKK